MSNLKTAQILNQISLGLKKMPVEIAHFLNLNTQEAEAGESL